MDKISVIIPVYKVEQYLRQCMDSVVNQTYKNLEIILIDDGSPDGCGAICDEYAAKDERIRLVHQENKGLSVARNVGMGMATGKWISFVDSDDWCELDMYEKVIASAEENDVDIAMYGSYRNNGENQFENQVFENDFVTDDENYIFKLQLSALNWHYGPEKTHWRQGYPWDKLYKASLITDNNLSFASHIRADEDIVFNLHAFHFAKKVSYTNHPLYHYRYNPTSIGYKFTPNRLEIDRRIYEEMVRIGKLYHLPAAYMSAVDTFYTNTVMLCGQRCFFHKEQPLPLLQQLKAANKVLHAEPVYSVLDRVDRSKLLRSARCFTISRHHNVVILYLLTKARTFYKNIKQQKRFQWQGKRNN